MATNSLLSAFSLGRQADQSTSATAFHTALSTESGADVTFDRQQAPLEHPGPASRSTARKTADELTGYTVPVMNNFLLRPKYIGRVLQAMGFTASTANNTTHYTHTFTLAADASMLWMTAIHKWIGSATLSRLVKAVRGTQLDINARASQRIESQFAGIGLVEGNAAGTETLTAEVDVPFSAYSGSITWDIGGASITQALRGINTQIRQELDTEDWVLFSTARNGLNRKSFAITGTLQGFDMDPGTFEIYKRIVRGGTSGTAPSTAAPATGALSYVFQSQANISGASVPYSLTFTYDTVQYNEPQNTHARGSDLIRCDVPFEMIDNDTTPISIVLVNDVSAYS